MIRKIQNICSIILLIGFVTTSLHAQKTMKVGYVDMDYILENVKEYQVANEQFSLKVEGWQKEIEEKQKEIDARKEQLEAEKPLMTAELINDAEEEIQLLERNLESYKQKRFGAEQGDYIRQRITLAEPIQDQIFNIVQEIGKSRGYDYIVEKKDISLLYVKERHDLSDMILRVLNKKSNADDRHKNMAELLQENYNFEMMTDKQKRKAEQEAKRQELIKTKQEEREERRRKILEERAKRLKEIEEAKKKKENNN